MTDFLTSEAIAAFFQVVMIDLVLAGDNAVVIGLASAALPPAQRRHAIIIGIVAATVLRIAFAGVATQLLQVLGLLLAGGLLLLWVGWKMWCELRAAYHVPSEDGARGADATDRPPAKSFGQAVLQIIVADVSMSLDNVLAVAGAAREHPVVLVFGLVLSIGLMGIAANVLGNLLQRHRWIAYAGLAIVLYVAGEMIFRGAQELRPAIGAAASLFA